MIRRRLSELEQGLLDARSRSAKALAHSRLAVFHDNNGREAEAIPHYRAAIRQGLRGIQAAQAHAWLASSYWKVGRPRQALAWIAALRRRRLSADLHAWVGRLEGRVRRDPWKYA
jgi:Tetratrico peptide repeat